MRLAALICDNGLGHFKRMIGVLARLLQQEPGLHLDIFCAQWQIESTRDWEKSTLFRSPNCSVYTGVVSPGVHLNYDLTVFDDERLIRWEERLSSQKALKDADLVISDNLTGVLSIRPDAVLMGSFLWSEVYAAFEESTSAVKAFVDHERDLLKRYRPPMLCVGAIATPGVRAQTQAVLLPWFGQDQRWVRDSQRRTNRIGLLGGATEIAATEMMRLIKVLLERTPYEIALPDRLIRRIPEDLRTARLAPFGFELADYASCDLVICRPGVGTITDCLVTETPMIFFAEAQNFELEHNADALEKAGVALSLRENVQKEALSAVERILTPASYREIIQNIQAMRVDGIEVATQWIRQHLN